MATYKEIQDYVKGKYHFTPKSCWITDVKERNGLPVRRAYNGISDIRTKYGNTLYTIEPQDIYVRYRDTTHFGSLSVKDYAKYAEHIVVER